MSRCPKAVLDARDRLCGAALGVHEANAAIARPNADTFAYARRRSQIDELYRAAVAFGEACARPGKKRRPRK